MRDILTVTLNPALDLSTGAPSVFPGVKLRCDPVHIDPGGGGINVSRAVALLGGTSRCFVVLAGGTGDRVADLLTASGMDLIVHPGPGETRSSLSVIDHRTGEQYRFMLPGPDWNASDMLGTAQAIHDTVTPNSLVVISGSLPPGVPQSILPELCRQIAEAGADAIVDTSGPALHEMASARATAPLVLRMNNVEADDIAGHHLRDLQESADFASTLVARGAAKMVIIARGPEGSVLATQHERLHSRAANVPVRSKVGAGDTFVGGFTFGLARGDSLGVALQRGVSAASAAVMTEGTLLCRREDADRLFEMSPSHPI
jgi:6-phosphofructokinase 2